MDAGSNLQDHVSTKLVFETTDALLTEAEFPFTNGLVIGPDLHLLPVQDRRGTRAHITIGLLRSHSRGRVDLERIDHRLLSDQRDRQALAAAFQLARELADHDAMRKLGRPVTTSIEEALGVYFHPAGTCSEVVDDDFRVQGFENLYVCDASVFATLPRANTHLPTLALAEKLGSEL
jgi:choline dehydrogenase-like flavoprotein